jgi:gliding motility-associated lipoprotein GldD
MKKQFLHYLTITACLFCAACNRYSPKPTGYYRIDLPEPAYIWQAFPEFDCCISAEAEIIEIPSSDDGKFFNIAYSRWNAQIYCSFFEIKKNNLTQLSEESRKFVYLHTIKADNIREQRFENADYKVFGILYDIQGNVASPTQFVMTDSLHSFLRGALYFNNIPNQDSIAPVLEYINNDILILMESLRWKR